MAETLPEGTNIYIDSYGRLFYRKTIRDERLTDINKRINALNEERTAIIKDMIDNADIQKGWKPFIETAFTVQGDVELKVIRQAPMLKG